MSSLPLLPPHPKQKPLLLLPFFPELPRTSLPILRRPGSSSSRSLRPSWRRWAMICKNEGEKVFWALPIKFMWLRYLVDELRRRSVELGVMGFLYQPKSLSIMTISKSVPAGSGELTPDKPINKGGRRSKTSGLKDDGGTVDEAGTSNPSGMRGCQPE